MPEQAVYTHGHHPSVVKSHARRTAQNSAAFLLPHIKPHHRILDVGCGPGSITIDLAQLVPQGSVVGIDAVEDVLSQARSLARERGVEANLTFQRHDANELPFADGTFDIVFCHQVLQHVRHPAAVLKEMARVARRDGGIVAARDADYKTFAWYPELPGLERWGGVYQAVAKANGAEPNAARYLKAWAKEAGFGQEDVTFSWDVWNYQDEEAVAFAKAWTERTLHSTFATKARDAGFATEEDLKHISDTWREWGEMDDAFIVIPNGEILCRVR
ncbi:ubiE/COQ5 methyltransferase [Xylariaceae sp. FL1651]|nr:ubiE/COQ5 methyltransferase [Xylariaceae sp. FL1651]